MKKYFVLLFIAVSGITYGQHNVSGLITDQQTNEPIVGATVYFPQIEKATSSSLEGFFDFENIPAGNHSIVISALGYASFSTKVNVPTEENLNFSLKPSAIEMEEVIISTPFHRLQSENVMRVSRATMEQLNRQGNTTLAEGLSQIPGVENMATGTGIGKPVIRGLSSNRVLVYTQGVRLENQQYGDEHGLGLNSSGMESVEVIKGPASLLYGSDAIGGVLYFNPEKYALRDTTTIDARALYHSNTLGYEGNIGFKTSAEKLKFLARANYATHSDYETGDGERVTNTRFNEWDFKTGMAFQDEKMKSDLRYNYNFSTIGIPEEIGMQNTSKHVLEPYQQIGNHVLSLDNQFYFQESSLEVKLGYVVNNRKEFEEHHEHHEEEEEEEEIHDEHGEEPALHMLLSTLNYNAQYHLPKKGNFETIVGLQGMFQNNTNKAEEILIPNANTTDVGAFITTHYHLEKVDMQAGIRFDNRKISTESHHEPNEEAYIAALEKDFQSFNGAFGIKFDISSNFVSRLNLSSGFRAPNLAELTSNGSHHGTNRYEVGNPDLDNEQSFQADLALEYRHEHLELFVNGFYNRINDYIYLQPTGEIINEDVVFNYVQDNARLYGSEAGIHLHPHPLDWLHLESSFQMVIGEREDGENLPLIPATSFLNTLRIELDGFSLFNDFNSFITLRTTLDQERTSVFETETGGYTILNAGFGGDFAIGGQIFGLQISASNLLNKTYISHLSRLKPDGIADRGRNITVGLSTRF